MAFTDAQDGAELAEHAAALVLCVMAGRGEVDVLYLAHDDQVIGAVHGRGQVTGPIFPSVPTPFSRWNLTTMVWVWSPK